MIESSTRQNDGITSSHDDPKLYDYVPGDAPDDVFVNIGNAPIMVSAPHAVNDPHRMEVGDRRRGSYYAECLGKLPGFMQLCRVDGKRLNQVNKIRNIRIGDEEDDWIKAARRKSEAEGADQPPAPRPMSHGLTPLQRAARGM